MIVGFSCCLPAASIAQLRVSGATVDESGRRIAGVLISPEGSRRTAITDDSGTFVLVVSARPAALRARRLGYVEARYEIGPVQSLDSLRVVMRELPALLSGVSVDAPAAPAMAQAVTAASVRQAPALLEPDVFRALLLLPGVSQPNDLRGRIHLAGGSSDETGVRLDGHPLQDPFHLFGLLGAFNVGALDRADVYINHVPLESQGFLSGVIELDTRAADDSGEVAVSLLAASATLSRQLPRGFDLLGSGRRSYLKAVASRVFPEAVERGDIPLYDVGDGLARVGWTSASGIRTETVLFATRDAFANQRLEGAPGYRPLRWGETLVGTRLVVPRGAWVLSARVSGNRWAADLDERPARADGDWLSIDRRVTSASAEVSREGDVARLRGGLSFDRRRFRHAWTVSEMNVDVFSPRSPLTFDRAEAASRGSLHAAIDASLTPRTSLTVGARAWHTSAGTFVGPQLVAGQRLTPRMMAEASIERRHQFDAELDEPVEGNLAPPRFLLAQPRVADVGALSLSWRPSAGRSAMEVRLQSFMKRYRRHPRLEESATGQRVDTAPPGFPQFAFGQATSAGVTASIKAATRSGVAIQSAYTYQRTRERDADGWFPSDADVPYSVTAFASLPTGLYGLELTVAGQAHSGAVTTPVAARVIVPDPEFFLGFDSRFLPGGRNEFRLMPYRRVDVGLRRRWTAGRARGAVTLQVLNALLQQNPRDVAWGRYYELLAAGSPDAAARSAAGVAGLPILPSLGVEIRW